MLKVVIVLKDKSSEYRMRDVEQDILKCLQRYSKDLIFDLKELDYEDTVGVRSIITQTGYVKPSVTPLYCIRIKVG